MKRKILVLAVALLLVGAVSSFAIGIGASFGLDMGDNVSPGIMLSLDLDQIPFLLGIGYDFEDPARMGVTADYIFVRENLVDILNIYAGVGGYLSVAEGGGSDAVDFGARIPIALYIFPVDFMELFLEVAPAFGFYPSVELNFQSAIGFRFWFD